MSYPLSKHFAPHQLHLNSKFADTFGGDPNAKSWCYFIFHEPIIRLPQTYKVLISLNSAEIPTSYYCINENNNTFYLGATFVVDGLSYSFVQDYQIPIGNYSAYEVAQYMSGKKLSTMAYLDLAVPGEVYLTATYDISLNKMKYSVSKYNNSCDSITNTFVTSDSAVFGVQTPLFIDAETYSTNCIDVTGARSAYIKLMGVHTTSFDSRKKISTNILGRIPLSEEMNNIIYWTNRTRFQTMCSVKNLNVLEIKIVDQDDNLIHFNGVDWSCSIEVSVMEPSDEIYIAESVSDDVGLKP